ncbi:MAG: hypothetical protein PHC68_08105 [Syntrophorhabdaceae bacterium]|nr:hypothetical protein [Syntrophorhabdaceae bacterium]
MEKAGFSVLKLAKELRLIAFSDIKDHCTIDDGGALQMIPLADIGKKSRAIKKVKENTKITESKDGEKLFKDSRVEYELYDKLEAIKLAASLMGMEAPQKHELDLTGSLMAAVAARLGNDGTDAKPKD